MANEKTPVVWDDETKKHRPLGQGEKMGGLDASSILSSDAGNLITSGSDGLAYASGSGIADPAANNLIETSDQGRLIVTADRIAEWIRLHPSDAADLAASLAPGLSTELADGKTIVASGGKLTVDPTNATAAQKKKINQALADADSGLVVDDSTGMLQVDFSQMPTDKFDALLKSLDMLVPLRANLDLYVGLNGSDTIVDGRGTQDMPFRTLQAAVQYVASTYNIGPYTVRIMILDGDYGNAATVLPSFSATTGSIVIQGASYNKNTVRVGALSAESPGALYTIKHLTATHAPIGSGTTGTFRAISGGHLELRDVVADQSGIANTGGTTYGFYAGPNSVVRWWAYNDNNYPTGVTFIATADSTVSGCMYAEAGGQISFASDINVQGTFECTSAFANASQFGLISAGSSVFVNPGRTPHVNNSGTVSGQRYHGTMLSIIQARGDTEEDAKAYYPGSIEGSVSSGSQFGWGRTWVNS